MREGFEKRLRQFGNMIKDEEELNAAEHSEALAERRLALLAEAADEFGTPIATQEEVYFRQKKKQRIMEKLHEHLRALDNRRPFEAVGMKNARTVYYDDATGAYFLRQKNNVGRVPLSMGALMTDGLWRVSYRMDSSVSRSAAKLFFIETARQELNALLNEQIAITEAESEVNEGSGMDKAYRAIQKRAEGTEEDPNGILAERMTESFLRKLTLDHQVPFEVLETDPEQDVEDKIDFILRVRGQGMHDRGVAVDIGVQFTTAVSEATIQKKERQIAQVRKRLRAEQAMVQDVVLVTLPLSETREVYERWNKDKQKMPGGPDALWSIATKRSVFEGVLQKLEGILSREEITAAWEEIEKELRRGNGAE